ncbi:MAG: hypothetical protein K1X53_01445 [Candidatus Sumerlaeaceae bacterium]|nr:hypothetical protein [Candidatus Sumerlaeaceae bacterium]
MEPTAASNVRPRPALFRALGRQEPPALVEIDGHQYTMARLVKHDSWAATAIYEGPAGQVVCKFNRTQSLLGIPMEWLGRRLAGREVRFLELLKDVACIPPACGPVYDVSASQRLCTTAAAHAFVEGHPMRSREQLEERFFLLLRETLDVIHSRGMAYVDLHKRSNILVQDDGTPCLIDFQVCYRPEGIAARFWPCKVLLRWLQQIDDYHYIKHVLRHCRAMIPEGEQSLDLHRHWTIRLWRKIATPLRALRRNLLVLVGVRQRSGRPETELEPEEADRKNAELEIRDRQIRDEREGRCKKEESK